MNDYISREDALNFEMNLEAKNEQEMIGVVRGMQIYADHIKSLPGFGWIPIDNSPITTGLYLVLCNEWGKARRRICAYYSEAEKWIDGGKNITKHVTHWMPLPEPPYDYFPNCGARMEEESK